MIIRDRTARVRGEADGVRYTGGDPVFQHRCDSALVARLIAIKRLQEDEAEAERIGAVQAPRTALRPYQEEAVQLLLHVCAHKGDHRLVAPMGAGRSLILCEWARRQKGRVAFVYMIPEMAEQMRRICERLGVTNLDMVRFRQPLVGYEAAIASEEMRGTDIGHERVVR